MSHTIASGIQPIQNLSVLKYLGDERKAEWGHHWINKGFQSEFKLSASLQYLKDYFQPELRTLKSWFAFLVLPHVRHHKMSTFCNYLHEVNSKFQNNCLYGCEGVKALCFVLTYIT